MSKYYNLIVTVLFLFSLYFIFFTQKNNELFSCEGEYIRHADDISFAGVLRFDFFSEKEGIAIFSGRIFDNENTLIAIKVSFEYTKINDRYNLISNKITKSTSNNNFSFNKNIFLLPEFYLKENHTFQISINKVNHNAYIIYDVITPVLYCYQINV